MNWKKHELDEYKSLDDYFNKNQFTHVYWSVRDNSNYRIYCRSVEIENSIPDSYVHEILNHFEKQFSIIELFV